MIWSIVVVFTLEKYKADHCRFHGCAHIT